MEIKNANLWVKHARWSDFIKLIPDHSVDLILVDPPFGLKETGFDQKHYGHDANHVIRGYQEAQIETNYQDWSY